jgi:hypothetical protein
VTALHGERLIRFAFAGPRNDPQYTGPKGFPGVAIVNADSCDEGLLKRGH